MKTTTGIVGLDVVPNAPEVLSGLYVSTHHVFGFILLLCEATELPFALGTGFFFNRLVDPQVSSVA